MLIFQQKYRWLIYLLIATAMIFVAEILLQKNNTTNHAESVVKTFNNQINVEYNKAKYVFEEIKSKNIPLEFDRLIVFTKQIPEDYSLFVFKGDSLTFWSDNGFTPETKTELQNRIIKAGNGYHQFYLDSIGDYTIAVGKIVKYHYPYQNDYLISKYNTPYNLPTAWQISFSPGGFPIKSTSGETLFYVLPAPVNPTSARGEILPFALYLTALLLIVLCVYQLYQLFPSFRNNKRFIFLFTADIIILRSLLFFFKIPGSVYKTDLFGPFHYASSALLPSLGDLLINVLLASVLGWFFYRYFVKRPEQTDVMRMNTLTSVLYLIATALLYALSVYLIDSVMINSTFELDFARILDFSFYSLTGFFIIANVLFAFFMFSYPLLRSVFESKSPLFMVIATTISLLAVFFTLDLINIYHLSLIHLLLYLLFVAVICQIFSGRLKFPNVLSVGLFVLILTSISTISHYQNKQLKENNERRLLAVRLSTDRDKMAEFLFNDIEDAISGDTAFLHQMRDAWMDPESESDCVDLLMQNYFKGFWAKYNAQITLCFPDKRLQIKPSNTVISCNTYFNSIIESLGETTSSPSLYFIRETYDASSYIAKIRLRHNHLLPEDTYVIIELTEKNVPKGLGYPELLLDRSVTQFSDISAYSYAIYSHGELAKTVGDYSYSLNEASYSGFLNSHSFFDKNGYNHLYHKIDKDTSIIISRRNETLLNKLAPFTYQFTFHVLLFLTLIGILWLFSRGKKRQPDLKTRLQIMLVGIILFASAIIGFSTLQNIKNLNSKKNQDMLSEKAHSVLIELEHKLGAEDTLEDDQIAYLEELLTKFSLVFFSDINIYAPDGNLLASSRPQVFSEGLKSNRMNADAYFQLAVNKRTRYILNEQIGNYNYLSAYMPFRNEQNKLTAYINLPYFARQQELRQEISSFLVAFTNIYVILTALAILIALLVGNYFTRPLQLIRNRFSRLNLEIPNEKIAYSRQDELGDLINEYNFMIEKLAESAEKLARSERESAWREMARQVAHEIKNPLTPMKLSIQHLHKSWLEDAPDWGKRLENTTKTLIQQIDSLSAIASAFSDFAKLPPAQNERIELSDILLNTLRLFNEHPGIEINFHRPNNTCYVFADEKQLTRAFVNLLKNSVQAIPADRNGKINVSIESLKDKHFIEISDNGAGISNEEKAKIFSPNFTTKSGGMGLGLAMVRNIVESAGGKIHFTSDPDSGTTFFIELPATD